MPVNLLPPITSSGPSRTPGLPLTSAERYARTRAMTRWHRIRSGVQKPDGSRTLTLWCGSFVWTEHPKNGPALLTDVLPDGDEACAVCVGKALGAGQDETPAGMPPLRYDPRWITSPSVCPGSGKQGLLVPLDDRLRTGRCLACGVVEPIRALGRGYSSYGYGLTRHAPGEGLVDPCPFHAWNYLERRGDSAGCQCGWGAE